MSAEILNSQGHAVVRAEANIGIFVMVRRCLLRRCRMEPFMSYNYLVSTGESLYVPYQPN